MSTRSGWGDRNRRDEGGDTCGRGAGRVKNWAALRWMSSEMGESSSVSLTLPAVLGWHQRHLRARALATTETSGEGAVWESLRILERAD